MAQTAVINIKVEPAVKSSAQKVAREIGLTLSGVINAYLKDFVRKKEVRFSVAPEIPRTRTLRMLKKAEEEIRQGKISPAFTNVKDAMKWLES
ncbi:type II toxin-antitoxin system RelB/DinJ family antitoxin [Candidatus Gottesmanbacteria bacterium]|nr:type II toxin-antitoxin system RelB/DinJ family antitoxin [Candidatus Gottesmanbacteria bacterium]